MIKNRLSKALIAAMMLSSAVMADTVISPEYSLIGIEGGVTQINYDVSNKNKTFTNTVGNIGFKLGAESQNYRIFLTANYYTKPNSSYDYIGTYGGELDYLLNVSPKMNIYIGANAGIANMKFKVKDEIGSRTISNPYYGPDAGVNFHVNKLIDLELGTRLMLLDATNTKNGVTYTFNDFITGYASIIFKYNMD